MKFLMLDTMFSLLAIDQQKWVNVFPKGMVGNEPRRDFPGRPVVRTACFHCREREFNSLVRD